MCFLKDGFLGKKIKSQSNPPTFIDLFAGCGGLSLGLLESGWQGKIVIESCNHAFSTLKHNLINGHSQSPINNGFDWPGWLPVEAFEISEFLHSYQSQLRKYRGKIDLLAGGPPCQGFSFAGRRVEGDPRNELFRHYIKVVDLIQPKLVLIENVEGMKVPHGRREWKENGRRGRPKTSYSDKIFNLLDEHGYEVIQSTVYAKDFGVPQVRPRFITVGVRRDSKIDKAPDLFQILKMNRIDFLREHHLPTESTVNVSDALSDLTTAGKQLIEYSDPESRKGFKQIVYKAPITRFQKLMHGSLNGALMDSMRLPKHRAETLRKYEFINDNCRKGVMLSSEARNDLGVSGSSIVPLSPNKPSHTLTTLPDDLLHYCEPRIHTVREQARLQSFPDWFEFKGNYTTGGKKRVRECPRYTQIGNAVPPLLAKAMGEGLKQILSDLEQLPE
jgi:DNA (cytosine-5)-methyltransferase 1